MEVKNVKWAITKTRLMKLKMYIYFVNNGNIFKHYKDKYFKIWQIYIFKYSQINKDILFLSCSFWSIKKDWICWWK